MKEIFTPSKTDLFVAAAPLAYEHSRAARVALRMFFFLPMSIVAGTILPMFLFNIDDWSLLLFLPFIIGVPVLTFFILGEHPEDRAIREANQTRQIQQNTPQRVTNNQPKSIEEIVANVARIQGISYEEAERNCRGGLDSLNKILDKKGIHSHQDMLLNTIAKSGTNLFKDMDARKAVQVQSQPQQMSKNQQKKQKRRDAQYQTQSQKKGRNR
jgi:hypothetical protein